MRIHRATRPLGTVVCSLAAILVGATALTACGSSDKGTPQSDKGTPQPDAGDYEQPDGGTETPPVETTTYYVDADGDGFGDPERAVQLSEAQPGFVTNADDCNDLDAEVNPEALEICDGQDNDCDGTIDAGPCGEGSSCDGEGADIACVCDPGRGGAECGVLPWTQVSVGGRVNFNPESHGLHVCGLRGGQLFCWGENNYGQLGVPGPGSSTPQRVGTESDWTAVSAGGVFTCGIRQGELYCWGGNADGGKFEDGGFVGILGLGDDFDDVQSVDTPTRVGSDADWVAVNAGTHHTCGIRESAEGERTLWCWGKGGEGDALGQGATERSNKPVQEATESTDWVSVSAGERAVTCGIRASAENERTLWCWGHGGSFEWGQTSTPIAASDATDWREVSLGSWHVCGLRETEGSISAHCQGSSRHGQLGNGTLNHSYQFVTPTGEAVEDAAAWSSVSAGYGSTCGINAGKLLCWGRAGSYEIGAGDDLASLDQCDASTSPLRCTSPVHVPHARAWASVSTHWRHTCAIDVDGRLYCWGLARTAAGVGDAVPTPIEIP